MKSCHNTETNIYKSGIHGYIELIYSRKENAGNKMRTYKLFKQVFHIEPYLLCVKLPKHRVALTKLRVSSHHLAIETGRFHKPSALPVQERLCTTCGKIEDEILFICECNKMQP